MAVLAHEHEAEAEDDLALAVGGDGPAADLVADLHVGHVADADRARRPWRSRRCSWICSTLAARPRPWTSSICAGLADVAAADVEVVLLDGLRSTSSKVRPYLMSRSGSMRTWYCFS